MTSRRIGGVPEALTELLLWFNRNSWSEKWGLQGWGGVGQEPKTDKDKHYRQIPMEHRKMSVSISKEALNLIWNICLNTPRRKCPLTELEVKNAEIFRHKVYPPHTLFLISHTKRSRCLVLVSMTNCWLFVWFSRSPSDTSRQKVCEQIEAFTGACFGFFFLLRFLTSICSLWKSPIANWRHHFLTCHQASDPVPPPCTRPTAAL